MKKNLLLIFILFFSYQLSAQSSWTTSNNIQSTFYGNTDSINVYNTQFSSYTFNYDLFDYLSLNFLKQPMRTNLLLSNDSLYLVDTGKFVSQPTNFYTKSISANSIQVCLDTNLTSYQQGLNPNRYYDEENNIFDYYFAASPYLLKDNVVKLNLGHFSLFQNKVIRYKSINYRINAISNTSVDYAPKWQTSTLLPDSAVPAPSNNDFLVNLENNKIVFYHASLLNDRLYNLNLSQINNDTMYVDLHPSKLIYAVFPLGKNSNKTLATDFSNSPRFEVASYNDFTDSLTIGYYHEHVFNSLSPLQSFEWVTIYKQANNTISYTPSNLTVLNVSIPVPMQEFSLSVTQSFDENLVNWVTIGEENIDRFEVEKSKDGQLFETIHKEKATGNLGETKYSIVDDAPFNVTYYRIKALNIDNKFTYSNVVIVKSKNSDRLTISPNPNSGTLNIDGLQTADFDVNITSLDGRRVYNNTILGQHSANIDIRHLPIGTYVVLLENLETGNITKHKIVKQ